MSYYDARLLDRVAYGWKASRTYLSTRVQLRGGRERRNDERLNPIHRFVAPYDRIPTNLHQEVIDAFHVVRAVHSFRIKDWADYKLENVVIGTADGTADQQIQIVKPSAFAGQTFSRKITKPVDSTVYTNATPLAVTANDVPIAFSVDYTTGMLTLTGTAGHVIRVTGEFDVPVRFDDDDLAFVFTTFKAHNAEVALTEDLWAGLDA